MIDSKEQMQALIKPYRDDKFKSSTPSPDLINYDDFLWVIQHLKLPSDVYVTLRFAMDECKVQSEQTTTHNHARC